MSYQAQAWAAAQTTGSFTTKALLMALANYANAEGVSWYRQRRIAADTEMAPRTIKKHLAILVDLGLLVIVPQYRDDGTQRSSIYHLQMPGEGAPGAPGGVHQVHPGRAPGAHQEPSVEPSVGTESVPTSSAPARARGRQLPRQQKRRKAEACCQLQAAIDANGGQWKTAAQHRYERLYEEHDDPAGAFYAMLGVEAPGLDHNDEVALESMLDRCYEGSYSLAAAAQFVHSRACPVTPLQPRQAS